MLRLTIRDLLWLMVVVGLACGWFVSSKQKIPEYERRLAGWEKSLRKYESICGNLQWEVHNLTQERESWHKRSEMYESLYMEFQNVVAEAIPQDQSDQFWSEVRRLYEQKKKAQLRPAPKPPSVDPFSPPN